MKNIKKQGKESGKVQIALLVAVALAVGGTGVWSELKAASPNLTSQIDVFGGDTYASISENGDGTASVSAFHVEFCGFICSFLGGFDAANTSYSQTVDIRPGASGKQIGSGMGSATLAGTLFDFGTFTETPVTISFQMAVAGAGENVYSFNNHTLDVHHAPFSGPVTASRVASIGTAASGATAAAISMSVDGAPLSSQAGIFGQVQAFTSHTVTRIQ